MSKYPLGKIYQHEAKLMATQYTDILKLALPVQGELTGTWGDTVNDEITSMVEQAIAGRTTVTSWTANSHTLTVIEGATSESRAAILNITDPSTSLTGAGTVICPTQSKIYIVENNTVRTITVKTSAGTGISIPSGLTGLIFCDGTNVEDGLTYLPYDNSSSGLTATNVQAAIDELDTAVDLNTASLTALGTPATTGIALLNDETAGDARTTLGLGTAAVVDASAYGASLIDDADASAARTTLGISTFGSSLIDDADAAAARTTLGLGTAAVKDLNNLGDIGTGAVTATADALVNGLTVGRGAGGGVSNTVFGRDVFSSNTSGVNNVATGRDALFNNTTGSSNTAVGKSSLQSNTTGAVNTATGFDALKANTSANNNTAYGGYALTSNTIGANNSASSAYSLFYNTTGSDNTANGTSALEDNTTGTSNTASGRFTLRRNTTASFNTATGADALRENTTGEQNTAIGFQALRENTTGNFNTANGRGALVLNTTGNFNTASGHDALLRNTTGTSNTASGKNALLNNTTGVNNTALGTSAMRNNSTGGQNLGVGVNALETNTTGSGNTAINPQNASGSYTPVFNPTTQDNRFCMGSTAVTNAYIQVAWTVVSDERDKAEFAPVPHGLDFVNQLKPTAYKYKKSREDEVGHGMLRYGFKAQDVLAIEGDNPVIVDNEDSEKLRMVETSLIPVLVNAINELTARVAFLEGK